MDKAIIPILGLFIAILAVAGNYLSKWQKLDVRAAEADVRERRCHRALEELERRVADVERYVTSPAYDLDRRFQALSTVDTDTRKG